MVERKSNRFHILRPNQAHARAVERNLVTIEFPEGIKPTSSVLPRCIALVTELQRAAKSERKIHCNTRFI